MSAHEELANELSQDHQAINELLQPMHDAPVSRSEEFRNGYDHGPETPWRANFGDGYTTYLVHGSHSDDVLNVPGAKVRVSHPGTGYDLNPEISDYTKAYSADYQDGKYRVQRGDGPDGQGALFDVHHRSPYVNFMASHPDFRHHIPTLLAVANIESQERFREPLHPDSSLSVHSSKIVHRLAEAGVIKPPSHETRNDLTAEDYKNYTVASRNMHESRKVEIAPSTIQRGKQFLREALGRPRQAVQGAVAGVSEKSGKQQLMFE